MRMSIIVCTYNRCEGLPDTLHALRNQRVVDSSSVETILVDNGSNDGTKQVVESLQKKFSWPLRYIFEMKQGLSHARNRGIAEAKGDFLVFTDDDVILDKNCLTALWENAEKFNADALGGRILPLWSQEPPAWMQMQSIWGPLALLDHGSEVIIPERLNRNLFYGANMAFRKSVFNELGLFRTDLGVVGNKTGRGEDTEMLERAFKAGKKLLYAPDAIVYHKVSVERMSMKYIRKIMYESGISVSSFAFESNHSVLSRWFIRECAENGLRSLWAYFNRNREVAIEQEVEFWFQLGRIKGALSSLWKNSPTM